MKRILIGVVAVMTVVSLSACGSIGKGKAPPPEPAPAVITK
ncbi:MAG: ABC transporter [Phyllobacterium sp.]|jgi:predicted small lipoprotein YifL